MFRRPTTDRCRTCGKPDHLNCTCTTDHAIKAAFDTRTALIIHTTLTGIRAGYYQVDRP